MTDTTRLLTGLEELAAALGDQIAQLRERGAELDSAWVRLEDCYHGTGAEMFTQAFARAGDTIAAYGAATEAILPILRERIAALARFDASGPPDL